MFFDDDGEALIMLIAGNQRRYILLKPRYTAFLHSIKRFGYKVGIKFDKDPLAVEQTNYVTKILNAYIVYDLHAWPTVPFDNLKLKNCFFGVTNIVKNSDKER